MLFSSGGGGSRSLRRLFENSARGVSILPSGTFTSHRPGAYVWAWTLGPLMLLALALLACSARNEVLPDERRAQALNRAIMCPVCPGESIDQSQNPLAAQMRGIVAQKLAEGESGSQIKSFFVERYGDSVLLSPSRRGFNLLAWLMPPIGVAGAAIAAVLALRLMRRPVRPGDDQPVADMELSMAERDDYFRRIESALDLDASGKPDEHQGGKS